MSWVRCQMCDILTKYLGEKEKWNRCHLMHQMDLSLPNDGEVGKIIYKDIKQNKNFRIRLGRWIKKSFGNQISDHDLQKLTADITNLFWISSDQIKVLRGEDIRDFYLNGGISSCMAYRNTQDFLDIYVDNPDVIGLVTIKSGGKAGRALLWTTEEGDYLDRIYHTSDSCLHALQNWGKQHCKMSYQKDSRPPDVEVYIRDGLRSFWPYLDTYCYMNPIDENECTLSSKSGKFCLQSTEGTIEDLTFCDHCGAGVVDDYYYIEDGEYVCFDCYSDNYFSCYHCGGHRPLEDEHVSGDEHSLCYYCFTNYYSECENCSEYYCHEFMNEIDGKLYCDSCAEEAGDE